MYFHSSSCLNVEERRVVGLVVVVVCCKVWSWSIVYRKQELCKQESWIFASFSELLKFDSSSWPDKLIHLFFIFRWHWRCLEWLTHSLLHRLIVKAHGWEYNHNCARKVLPQWSAEDESVAHSDWIDWLSSSFILFFLNKNINATSEYERLRPPLTISSK